MHRFRIGETDFNDFDARLKAIRMSILTIASGLGGGHVFDKAISKFAVAYADQTVRDHQVLVNAVDSGRIAAEVGV